MTLRSAALSSLEKLMRQRSVMVVLTSNQCDAAHGRAHVTVYVLDLHRGTTLLGKPEPNLGFLSPASVHYGAPWALGTAAANALQALQAKPPRKARSNIQKRAKRPTRL